MSEKILSEEQFQQLLKLFAYTPLAQAAAEAEKIVGPEFREDFGRIETLYADVVTREFETYWVPIFTQLKTCEDPDGCLRAFFNETAKLLKRNDPKEMTILMHPFQAAEGGINIIKRRIMMLQAKQFGYFEEFLTRMIKNGKIPADATTVKISQDLNDLLYDQCSAALNGATLEELEKFGDQAMAVLKEDLAKKPRKHHVH